MMLLSLALTPNEVTGQYSTTKVRSKHQQYTDSLKSVDYPYIFPFKGQEAYKRGFDIPYPVGMMANFFWSEQGILIDNFNLGITDDGEEIFPYQPLSEEILTFGNNYNETISVNVRPDLWLLPFLNVYGIFGWGHSRTDVNVLLPFIDKGFTSTVEQSLSTAGFGIMGAGGIGPVWVSVDANFTWNKPQLLEKATRVNVLGIRVGHTFVFKHKPQSNIALWVGGMRINMQSETVGQIQMKDALPIDELNQKGQEMLDYYDALPPLDQVRPKNLIIKKLGEALVNTDGSAIVKYGMDKQVKEKWNMLLGAQYQINKRWMFRTEGGIVGDRKSILFSLNYRFLL